MKQRTNCTKEERIQKIMNSALDAPLLSAQEIYEAMEEESNKPPKSVNNAFINKCSQLLCRMYACEVQAHATEAEKLRSKNQLCFRIGSRPLKVHFSPCIKRIIPQIIVATSLIVVIGIFGIVQVPGRLKAKPSEDKEQLMVYNDCLDASSPSLASATRPSEFSSKRVYSYEDAFSELGYHFMIPSYLPQEVKIKDVYIVRDETMDQITITYSDKNKADGENAVLFLDFSFINNQDAAITIAVEQTGNGQSYLLPSGKQIYVTKNLDENLAMYKTSQALYQASSTYYDNNTLIKIIDSLGG